MAIHDAYGRRTPYELLLPDEEWPGRRFPEIEGEAGQRGIDLWNPAAFQMLGATGGALGDVRAEEASAGAIHEHGLLLFHAYHFWKAGLLFALVTVATLRELLVGAPSPPPSWTAGLAGRAGYLQLPQHLVWVESSSEHPSAGEAGPAPESVDGYFWAASPRGTLHLALMTGLRAGRPGLSVVAVPDQPLAELDAWATVPAREGGAEFAADLPGAELDGLLGIRTPAEALKLAALTLRSFAGSDASPGVAEGSPRADGPAPTRLHHTMI